MKDVAFGIDFGTTNSIASAWGESVRRIGTTGKPIAFWAEEQRPHPSVVWYGADSEPVVGREARKNMDALEHSMGNVFVRSIKRRLGHSEEIELIGGERTEAWRVAAEVFRHIKQNVEQSPALASLEQDLTESVVTVPVNFSGPQRRDIRRAMNHAGIDLVTFLHEPFAALIGQFYDPDTKLRSLRGQRSLIFDWGGGTLDVCLVQSSADGHRVYELSHDGIEDRAGDDFDQRIMTFLKGRFIQSGNVSIEDFELDGATRGRFWLRSERAKIELSTQSATNVDVPQFMRFRGKTFNLQDVLTRDQFEELIENEIEAAKACVLRCLGKAGLTPGLVDHVLLVGGTSNVPAVRNMIESIFGAKVIVAKEPDAAIARGAAITAAENWKPYNVNTVSVKLSDDTYFPVLDAGALLKGSTGKSYTFYCTDHRSGQANFLLFERAKKGDYEYRSLGTELCVPTNPEVASIRSMDRIIAKFIVTEDLTLKCTAQSSSLGEERTCEVRDLCFGLKTD